MGTLQRAWLPNPSQLPLPRTGALGEQEPRNLCEWECGSRGLLRPRARPPAPAGAARALPLEPGEAGGLGGRSPFLDRGLALVVGCEVQTRPYEYCLGSSKTPGTPGSREPTRSPSLQRPFLDYRFPVTPR